MDQFSAELDNLFILNPNRTAVSCLMFDALISCLHCLQMFNSHPGVQRKRFQLEGLVLNHSMAPGVAADMLIDEFVAKKE